MPVYEYSALDVKGKAASGIIDADSAFSARQKLRASRYFPVAIKEIHETAARKQQSAPSVSQYFSRIKASEVAAMTRQLATLIGAGFPLVSALDTLVSQTKSRGFQKCLAKLKDSIVEGNSFAASLSLFSGTFSPLYINMVSAGESSGTLEIVLERLADITEGQQALNNRIRSALAYPILMSLIGMSVLFFLLTFIVPSVSSIFAEMNQALPTPTQMLIHTSNAVKAYWWIILLAGAALFFSLLRLKKTPKGRRFYDGVMLKLPVFGTLVRKLAVARFARTLSSLLENGVSLLSALDIVKNIAGNVLIADAVDEAAGEVGKGQGLGKALADSDAFPNLSIQMIHVGEQSGDLEPMLNKIADVYENEVESTVLSMTSLLEPVMILLMGVIVGFIVISICLPIFEMNQLIK